MSYSNINTSYNFFPTSPSSPNAFNLFISSQSPRDTYAIYEDLRQVLRPSNQSSSNKRVASSTSSKFGIKKFLGVRN